MERRGQVIGIHPEKIAAYKALHKAAWPEILAMITACHIRNFSIFLREPENLLFSYWEYHGTDWVADAARMQDHEPTRQWWALTDPCQNPLPSRAKGEWWAPLEEVFHQP